MDVQVLRLGHRPERDKRITTHVCLTARALGCSKVMVAERDDRIEEGVRDVTKRFGGPFDVATGTGYRPFLKDATRTKVHLTMYGIPLADALARIDPTRPVTVIVGAEKVPPEVYEHADLNVAVGNQPHSEVAALAIFLYALQGDAALSKRFDGAIEVEPSERGKVVRPRGGGLGASGGGRHADDDAPDD